MHFSPPRLHRSKSNTSSSSSKSKRSTRSEHGRSEDENHRPVKSKSKSKEPSLEREATAKMTEEEEEVTEWIEGQDIVIERRSCIPGEDVQVEVLHGAAAHLNGRHRPHPHELEEVKKAKEAMKKRGRKGEKEGGGVIGKCREVLHRRPGARRYASWSS